ncbi:MAG: 30S ribosomal protein S27ae [Candidatus Bathyarchaeia archaeon]
MAEEGKKEKSSGKKRGLWQIYEYDYKSGKIVLKGKKCPRCDKLMARHQAPPRWSCGGCGYTEYIRKQLNEG